MVIYNTSFSEKDMDGMTGVSMHGAYYDTFYTSKDSLIREVSEKRFRQSVEAAVFHSIKRVVFHSAYRKFYDGFSKTAINAFLKSSIEFWKQFEHNIPDGMTIYLENVEDENPELLAAMLEGINSKKIRCCLDIGHAFCSSSAPLDRWVNVLGDYIGHVHLHDNDGKSDRHLWWAGVQDSKPLSILHNGLTDKLLSADFTLEKRKYSLHITLGREVVTDALPWTVEPFGESVTSIELMKSERIGGKLIYTAIHERKP